MFREALIKDIATYWAMQATDDAATLLRLNEASSQDVLVQIATSLHAEGYPGFSAHGLVEESDETILRRIADYIAHDRVALSYLHSDPASVSQLAEILTTTNNNYKI